MRAKDVLLEAGLEELQTAKACFALRHPKTSAHLGIFVLHVDVAGFAGEGPLWVNALTQVRKHVTLGKYGYDKFTFLGRPFQPNSDFTFTLHHTDYVNALERVYITKERRSRPGDRLTEKATHDYRSLVGQLAWPARETMPRLS